MDRNSDSQVHTGAAGRPGSGTRCGEFQGLRARPDVEDGLRLADLRPGSTLEVITQHTCYTIRLLFGRIALISGHPLYCPQPVLVTLYGSIGKGSRIQVGFIGPGLRLTFHHPEHDASIISSPIKEIHECRAIDRWSIASIVSL